MVNPLRVFSAALLLLSPVMTWITIVSVVVYQGVIVFGEAAQSNLLMVSSQQLGTNISSSAVAGSILALVLLPASGVAMIKSAKLGVPIALAGLAAYVIPIFQMFGSTSSGLQETFISPGIGLFVAGTGVILGAISYLSRPDTVLSLVASLKAPRTLYKFGASVGAIGLSLDVANHAVLGQLPDFIGSIPIEWVLHLGLVAAVVSLFVTFALDNRIPPNRYTLILSLAGLLLLGADAVYATVTGNLHDFLGHNLTETSLHFIVYYGITLTLISNFVGKTSRKQG